MIEAIGWAGSALLVISLLQGNMMRLRVLNLIAAVALVLYNALVETWPMVAMNAAVAIIDIWFIAKLRTAKQVPGTSRPVSPEQSEFVRSS
ncbi:hypothetical protein ABZ477_18985 [Microbacterium sp. NPDC019599]|uniref:hypothetical protein n=1 Tax=Microbacterium sp. NPDC019599 TaxID=3154690 RepID=UPI0033F4255E